MKTSTFAPLGALQLKAGTPAAEVLHATIVSLFSDGSGFSLKTDLGSFVDCFAFAFARCLAKLQIRQVKLSRERLAAYSWELLAELEHEFGVRPGPEDSLAARRAALLAAMKASLGSRRVVLEQALRDLHGDNYIGIHVHATADVTLWPSSLGDDPMLLMLPDISRKLVRLPFAISTGLGSPQYVIYEPLDPAAPVLGDHTLLVGDRIVVGVENLGLAETVEVTAVGGPISGSLYFQATFNNAHDPAALAAVMPFPAWGSSQRHIFVVLASAAAQDPETRRKTHELMAKMVTSVTTWSISPESAAFGAGPLTLGDAVLGKLGMNPMGTIAVP